MRFGHLLFWMGLLGFCGSPISAYSFANDTANSKKGVESTVSQTYFKMGDMRLLNNDWGSKELGCNSTYKIFIKTDGSFGWEFNRGACGNGGSQPDYPEVEFGIHPFGTAKEMVTSPDFTSTTLLPLQIKDIQTASVKIEQMTIDLQKATSWNLNFEMWFTTQHPVTGNHNCPYAEIMTFWGWEDGRWACDQTGTLSSGGNNYAFCHYGDQWGCGWKYYQYRINGGPMRSFSGTLDVKAILDLLVNTKGVSKDLWVSRFEIGSEIGDNTIGKVSIKNLTFEVNGVAKSPQFSDPTDIQEKSPAAVNQKWENTIFPAGTSVEVVNLQGVRKILPTGSRAMPAVEISRHLPKGIYLMKDGMTKKAIVVPVL